MTHQALARFMDRFAIEYVREYPHPVQRVWRAICDPAELSAWFWTGPFPRNSCLPHHRTCGALASSAKDT